MKYDDLYQYTGEMGTFQWCVFAMVYTFCMFAIESITMIFVGGEMPHWCKVDDLTVYPFDLQKYVAIPSTSGGGSDADSYSSCEMFAFNYSAFTEDEIRTWNRSLMTANGTQMRRCDDWVYDQTTFVSTIISKFDLVCGQEYLNQFVSTIYMAGTLIGGFFSGAMSDRFGRKPATISYLVIRVVGIAMSSFAPNYPTLAVGRFILGLGTSGCFLTAYVLMMEIVGPSYRTAIGCVIQISLSVGFMLQPIIANFVRDEVKYQLAALGPNIIFFSFVFLLPESPRWLIVSGNQDKGEELLQRICSVNGTRLPENFSINQIENEDEEVREQKNCTSLLRTPRLRVRTVIVSFIWFTCSMMYYGLSLNTGALSGSIYTNTLISGAVEIPSLIICIFLLNWKICGRRLTSSGTFLVAGLSSIVTIPLILYDYGSAVTGMSMLGKASITMTYSVIYIFASEVFPTEVRNVGMGTGSMFGGIGSMIAPYIGAPAAKLWKPLPSVMFGVLATLAGVSCLFLPETLGQPLPDTIDQVEHSNRKESEAEVEKAPQPEVADEWTCDVDTSLDSSHM